MVTIAASASLFASDTSAAHPSNGSERSRRAMKLARLRVRKPAFQSGTGDSVSARGTSGRNRLGVTRDRINEQRGISIWVGMQSACATPIKFGFDKQHPQTQAMRSNDCQTANCESRRTRATAGVGIPNMRSTPNAQVVARELDAGIESTGLPKMSRSGTIGSCQR
jgi:hypothetical protein